MTLLSEKGAKGLGPISDLIAKVPLKAIFQRLPGVWFIAVFLFGLFGPAHLPILFGIYFLILHLFFIGSSTRASYGIWHAKTQVVRWSTTDWLELYCRKTGAASGQDLRHDMPFDDVNHVIILPNYKENMDTLCETLDVLSSHSRALTQYKVCLAMEESETASERKAITLVSQYSDLFLQIVYTIHPVGLSGEIRGKSSNVAWASKQMAKKSKNHGSEIITVMDADTCFSEDYFNSLNYFYCTATPDERRLLMFAPSTIFDRNAQNVPIAVRTNDIMWSIGVMSNMFPSSPVRFPCSAYSVSMDLASAVGYWDASPEAIGEDMHMYVKCFFATEGRVRVEPIWSPASCCNIEGKNYMDNCYARFNQAKRHMWGSLDTGYSLRNALLAIVAPGVDSAVATAIRAKKAGGAITTSTGGGEAAGGAFETDFKLSTLGYLLHRLLEAHIVMGHLVTLLIMTSLLIPLGPEPSSIAVSYWDALTTESIHPTLLLILDICGWIRFFTLFPVILLIINYERYHHWVADERWRLAELNNGSSDLPAGSIRVQPLGRRPQLVSLRTKWNIVDWIVLPICGIVFQCAPQLVAQISHLWTDRLDYAVAAKPTLNRPSPLMVVKRNGVPVSGVAPAAESDVEVAVFGGAELLSDLRAHRIDSDGDEEATSVQSHPSPRQAPSPFSEAETLLMMPSPSDVTKGLDYEFDMDKRVGIAVGAGGVGGGRGGGVGSAGSPWNTVDAIISTR